MQQNPFRVEQGYMKEGNRIRMHKAKTSERDESKLAERDEIRQE
jgi:hypothetical protein